VLLQGVSGITDLITTPGLINVDFADVKAVMSNAGSALMGIGSSRGEDRAVAAAEAAISSPLLEASIEGAHGVLLSIAGGSDLGLFEINEAAQLVSESAHTDANIIFGAVIDDALGDEVRVTVIAAGFDGGMPKRREQAMNSARPQSRPAAGATTGEVAASVATQGQRRPAPPYQDGSTQQPPYGAPQGGTGQPGANQSGAGQTGAGQGGAGQGDAGQGDGQFGRTGSGTSMTDDTVPVPNTGEGRPGAGTTHSARPQLGDPVRTAHQPSNQPAPHSAAPHSPAPSQSPTHTWPSHGPSNAPAAQPPAQQRQPRKPEYDDDELDIPDFLK
jgi:cell division protein FtsZ